MIFFFCNFFKTQPSENLKQVTILNPFPSSSSVTTDQRRQTAKNLTVNHQKRAISTVSLQRKQLSLVVKQFQGL